MSREEYELMKLQMQWCELDPYSFDPEVVSIEDFTWRGIRDGVNAYTEYMISEHGENFLDLMKQDDCYEEELKIYLQMQELIRTLEFDTFEDTEEYKDTLAFIKTAFEDFNERDYTQVALITLVKCVYENAKHVIYTQPHTI